MYLVACSPRVFQWEIDPATVLVFFRPTADVPDKRLIRWIGQKKDSGAGGILPLNAFYDELALGKCLDLSLDGGVGLCRHVSCS